ncbi:hypothetical protein D522_02458, partial [Mycobacterium avium subsp. paratuberculosis S5]
MPIPRPTLTRKVRWHIAILTVVVALMKMISPSGSSFSG